MTRASRRILGALFWLPILASTAVAGPPRTPEVVRGPYLQLATPTSIVVRWRTDVATDSRVLHGTTAGNLVEKVISGERVTDHEIPVTGLSPHTRYYYAVGTTREILAGDTPDHFFVTAPEPATTPPVRIWAIGDFGTADFGQRQVRDAYYDFAGTVHTDLWLMLGDNAYNVGTDAEYQSAVFDIYPDLLVRTPFCSTRGNHETFETVYYGLVTNPAGGEAGGLSSGTEAYYSYDFANIHFVCLDSEGSDRTPEGPMLTWLELDLASTDRDWIIAFWHHPPYTKGTHNSDLPADSAGRMFDMRRNALPILEAGGVDLVLSGHSHVYERSFLIDGHYGTTLLFDPPSMLLDPGDGRPEGDGAYEKVSQSHEGTVYVVMGSSGQLGTGPLNHPAMFLSLPRRGSLVLDVAGKTLNGTMVESSGEIADTFTLIKCGPGEMFIRGNADGDDDVDMADVLYILHYLYLGGPAPVPLESADVNGNGIHHISDPVYLLNHLFQDQVPPPPPFPEPGCPRN